MTNYYIKLQSNKPKEDINEIVEAMGYVNVAPRSKRRSGMAHLMVKLGACWNILWRMHRGDRLLIQYPMKKFVTPATWCAHLKGAKVTVLIHDLGCFRRKKLTVAHEMRRMNRIDDIIAHNPSMKAFMEQNGCTTPIRTLGIFDYLSPSALAVYDTPHTPWRIVYAGGLGYSRNPFLYELDSHITNWQMELYGKSFEPERAKDWQHIHYNGQLPPDELIARVEGDFGLVWDGDSLDECSGAWGEYLRVNNPHKTSFYLRAGIPIIIWSKAALAPFVLEQGAGIAIDSLRDLNAALQQLTPTQYANIRHHAQQLGNLIAQGHFTRKALTS
jgi:hypothetical protein